MWRPGGAAAGDVAVDGVLRQNLSTPGVHGVEAWGGRFVVKATPAKGVPAAWLVDCELRPRRGGERFQFQVRSMPRSLKKQFQSASIPARDRGGPLVFAGDQLLYVPGLGLDARAWRDGGADLLMLEWVADDD